MDGVVAAAFNAHQRRTVAGRQLLGPDAPAAAATSFTQLGARVEVRPSPWQLTPAESALATEWLRGWVAAAQEQQPGLGAERYLAHRLAAAAVGGLHVTVHHEDVLARWGSTVPHPAAYQSAEAIGRGE